MKINVSATKRHALLCSQKLRAGKFSRVGEDFIQQIEAALEGTARVLAHSVTTEILPTAEYFLTPAGERAVLDAVNAWIAKAVQKRVKAHPSLGKTLKA